MPTRSPTNHTPHSRIPVRIGIDTFSIRLFIKDAGLALLHPDSLDDFQTMKTGQNRSHSGQVFRYWFAFHERFGIRVRAHQIVSWPGMDGEDRAAGQVDVTWEMSRIKDVLQRPGAPVHLNQGICSPDEAGSQVVTIVHHLVRSLGITEWSEEVLRIDFFADFQTPNKGAVLDAFSKLKPAVYKSKDRPTIIHNPGEGTVTHHRYAAWAPGAGQEETRLYARAPKILRDLGGGSTEPGSPLDQTLRLECVHGKERKGGCRALEIGQDFAARATSGLLTLEAALHPATWAGLLLARLKECRLYGEDGEDSIVVTPCRRDLRRRLHAAGISRGTASQYADIVFDGYRACKEDGYDVSKIVKKVQTITGKTFVLLEENDRTAEDEPFTDVVRKCIYIARACDGPNRATWNRRMFSLEGGDHPREPSGQVSAVAGQRAVDTLVADTLEENQDDQDDSLITEDNADRPLAHGSVDGVEDTAKTPHDRPVIPLSAQADTVIVVQAPPNEPTISPLLYTGTPTDTPTPRGMRVPPTSKLARPVQESD